MNAKLNSNSLDSVQKAQLNTLTKIFAICWFVAQYIAMRSNAKLPIFQEDVTTFLGETLSVVITTLILCYLFRKTFIIFYYSKTKTCAECNQQITINSSNCAFCSSSINQTKLPLGSLSNNQKKGVVIGVALLLCFMYVGLKGVEQFNRQMYEISTCEKCDDGKCERLDEIKGFKVDAQTNTVIYFSKKPNQSELIHNISLIPNTQCTIVKEKNNAFTCTVVITDRNISLDDYHRMIHNYSFDGVKTFTYKATLDKKLYNIYEMHSLTLVTCNVR